MLDDLLQQARWHEVNHKSLNPWPRVNNWLVLLRNNDVQSSDILAIIIGMYLFQEDDPRRFNSDREFRHSMVTRIMRLISSRKEWEGDTIYRKARVTVGVREFLSEKICMSRLGFLALSAARQMNEHDRKQRLILQGEISGKDEPFCL